MTTQPSSYLEDGDSETRLLISMLTQVVPGTEIIAVVTREGTPPPGIGLAPKVGVNAARAFRALESEVRAQLVDGTVSTFVESVDGIEWGALVEPIRVEPGDVVAGLLIARHGRTWSNRERAVTRAFANLLSHVVTLAVREGSLIHQRSLDELVTSVAERLMSTTAENRQETLDWVMEALGTFLNADAAFIRRNDLARGLSILEAEWPTRRDVPDPDPLGEVPFDADPIFQRMRDLRAPYLSHDADLDENYRERTLVGGHVTPATGAAVPMVMGDRTWGIIGFLHFSAHNYSSPEVNALQAVASMLVQLQARIDAEQRTRHHASHDELTGLPNRRALLAEMRRRLSANQQLAVMLIDLDRFKIMNDYLGHASGDRLLVTMADRIRTSKRANDFAARLGGDEFVFLVDGARSEVDVVATAHRILDIICRPVSIVGQEVQHTASIGVAMSEPDETSEVAILGWADVAMYAAKARGRNQVVVFDDALREEVNERSRTELLLREAIEQEGLSLHFQPEVDLSTGRLLAAEALVRWNHPTRGLLAAAQFISVAEETGLVSDLGRWVFAEACRQLGEWQRTYPNLDVTMRVNMSPADFKSGDLLDYVERCLRTHAVMASRLCIEITEHAVMVEPERTAKVLRKFQELGVRIALDDFGTGTASMTELKSLPVNALKLDASFVRGVNSDPYDAAIIESIIRLARALDLDVVAEGIETPEVVSALLTLGCTRGQGYLISRPLPAAELTPLLERRAVDAVGLRTR